MVDVMIDWWEIGTNALWILGLAILLASFSYRSYAVSLRRSGVPLAPGRLSTGFFARLGLLLITAGLGLTSSSLLQQVLWGIIGMVTLGDLVQSLRRPQLEPASSLPSIAEHADHT